MNNNQTYYHYKMKDFLNYLVGKSPGSNLTRKIETALELARSKEEWRCEYDTFNA